MAYHREWDKGKDSWGDGYAPWSSQDEKAGGKDHEDGYSIDGKRRKFNNGVRVVSDSYQHRAC